MVMRRRIPCPLRKTVALALALLLLFSFVPTGILAEETPAAEGELDETQRNSINMLNYLVVLTQEINASQNSRLYLEETYSALQTTPTPTQWTAAHWWRSTTFSTRWKNTA